MKVTEYQRKPLYERNTRMSTKYSLDWKDRVCQTVKKAFVCLSFCNPFSKPQWNRLFESDAFYCARCRRISLSLLIDHFASFHLLLAGRSSDVTHLTSMPLCLAILCAWNLDTSCGWSLISFQWIKVLYRLHLWLAACWPSSCILKKVS